jgi:2-isopropylmalate synthase
MHASGIHQDGVLKSRDTYEIIDPEIVGIPRNLIVLSARSGRHALQYRLQELGYKVLPEDMEEVYKSFLKLADQKGEIFDEDLYVLMGNTSAANSNFNLRNFSINTDGETASASVTMDVNGATYSDTSIGNGPIDAVFKVVDRIVGLPVHLEDYSLKSVSHGSTALGDATVKIKYKNSLIIGKGISTNIFEASALAYVNALSKAQNM